MLVLHDPFTKSPFNLLLPVASQLRCSLLCGQVVQSV